MITARSVVVAPGLVALALAVASCGTPTGSTSTSTTAPSTSSAAPPTSASSTSSVPTSSTALQSLITPGMVPGLLAAYTSKNNAANQHLSLSIQNSNEEGFASAGDDAAFAEDRAAGYATVDGTTYYPFTFKQLASDVVEQTQYPAVFAVVARDVNSPGTPAADRSSCADLVNLLLFAKDSASSPWRVAFEPVVRLSALHAFVLGGGGYGGFAGNPQTFKVPIVDVGATYAAALQAYANHGNLEDGLTATMFSGSCAIFTDFHALERSAATSGLTESFAFDIAPTTVVSQEAWEVKGGALLVLDVNGTELLKGPGGSGTVSVTHVAGRPATYEVPAGTYSSVTIPVDLELVVFDPFSTSSASAAPVGSTVGFLAGTGAPA